MLTQDELIEALFKTETITESVSLRGVSDDGLAELSDGLGFCLEMPPIDHELLTANEALEAIGNVAKGLSFKDDMIVQYYFLNTKSENLIPAQSRRDDFIFSKRTKKIRIVFFIKKNFKRPALFNLVSRKRSWLEKQVDAFKEEVQDLAAGSNASILNRDAVVNIFSLIAADKSILDITPMHTILDQIYLGGIVPKKSIVAVNRKFCKILRFKSMTPSFIEKDGLQFSSARLGMLSDCFDIFDDEAIINMNMNLLPQKGSFLTWLTYKSYFTLKNTVESKEISQAMESMADGKKMVHYDVNVRIFADSEEELKAKEKRFAKACRKEAGLELVDFPAIGGQWYFFTLPWNFSPKLNKISKTSNITSIDKTFFLMNLFAPFQGHQNGHYWVNNRNDGPVALDFRRTDSTGHIAIMATGGVGKSTSILSILNDEKEKGKCDYVFQIDSNSTAVNDPKNKVFVKSLGQKDLGINPFFGVFTKNKIENIVQLAKTIIKTFNPVSFSTLNERHIYLLNKGIITAINEVIDHSKFEYSAEGGIREKEINRNSQYVKITLDSINASIQEIAAHNGDEDIIDAAKQLEEGLRLFIGDGLYADFFLNSFSKDKKGHFIYDLEGLAEDSPLSELTICVVMNHIQESIKMINQEDPDAYIYVVFEELGILSRYESLMPAFIKLIEAGRKNQVKIISTAPDYKVFFSTQMGKKAISLSEHLLIGPLGSLNVGEFLKTSKAKDHGSNAKESAQVTSLFEDEAIIQAISLLSKTEDYTEFLYLHNAGLMKKSSGVYRFYRSKVEIKLALNSLNMNAHKQEHEVIQ